MKTASKTQPQASGNRRQSECERALERAHQTGIWIAGRGYRKQDGARVYAVTSASEANRLYVVAVLPARIECPCAHAKHGGYCMHRALVHELLEREQRNTSMRRGPAAFSLLKK